ncbi:hypothetical protein [Streptomyces sp. NPDC058335]|uniref:hypothetical protein n=1 Tax=Streptomyces sp. NPDC058335 TaxID=3346451 RepID=UPI00364E1FFC
MTAGRGGPPPGGEGPGPRLRRPAHRGRPRPLSTAAWPHDPARIGLHTTEGPSWLLDLTPTGVRLLDGPATAGERVYGSASDVLLALNGRLPLDRLRRSAPAPVLEGFLD